MTTATDKMELTRQFVRAADRLPTLFELEDEGYRLLALHDEGLSENGDLEAELALIDQLLMEKTESYVSVIRSLETMAEARKAEADRLKARAATAQQHAEFLRNRLLTHMQTTNRDRIETARFTLSVRTNNPSVVVVDATAIPSEFNRTKVTIEPDKVSILAYAKATGEVVPGTEIVRNTRLQIS